MTASEEKRGKPWLYDVPASAERRQEIGNFLARSGLRRSQWFRHASSGLTDRYSFKEAKHAILLRLFLD